MTALEWVLIQSGLDANNEYHLHIANCAVIVGNPDYYTNKPINNIEYQLLRHFKNRSMDYVRRKLDEQQSKPRFI